MDGLWVGWGEVKSTFTVQTKTCLTVVESCKIWEPALCEEEEETFLDCETGTATLGGGGNCETGGIWNATSPLRILSAAAYPNPR